MFQYGPEVSTSTKNNVTAAFIGLKEACRLPDGSKYILSIDGGLNNSPEGHTKGMEVRERRSTMEILWIQFRNSL